MNINTYLKRNITVEENDHQINLNGLIHSYRLDGESLYFTQSKDDTLSTLAIEIILGKHKHIKNIFKDDVLITREEFYQNPNYWSTQTEINVEKWNRDTERSHPIRKDIRDGYLYERFVPGINKTLSIRGTDIEKDLETFHQWHNQPRVYEFWELNQSKEELKSYMEKIKNDPHMIPTIIEFDHRPVGYFEMYWTLEDRLGPYYEADAFDRGFHFLIGEKDALGFENTDAVLKSALHYLFLNDPRTRRVMAEPRHDNKKVIRYAAYSGWKILKEFDFPHKRAALLECKRENFFNGVNF